MITEQEQASRSGASWQAVSTRGQGHSPGIIDSVATAEAAPMFSKLQGAATDDIGGIFEAENRLLTPEVLQRIERALEQGKLWVDIAMELQIIVYNA